MVPSGVEAPPFVSACTQHSFQGGFDVSFVPDPTDCPHSIPCALVLAEQRGDWIARYVSSSVHARDDYY